METEGKKAKIMNGFQPVRGIILACFVVQTERMSSVCYFFVSGTRTDEIALLLSGWPSPSPYFTDTGAC